MTTVGEVRTSGSTGCCIVGAGPAGMILALLLARQGIEVTLLERHGDFDRDFRGDTIHPSTLDLMDQLGLIEELLLFPHGLLRGLQLVSNGQVTRIAEFRGLGFRYPFIMLLPQATFLAFLADQARQYPHFHLELGANVQEVLRDGKKVCGVRYQRADHSHHELRALLTVGADGRFSKLRQQADLAIRPSAPPMDVIWFCLPRLDSDPTDEASFYVGDGQMLVFLDRGDSWQIGMTILKGSFTQTKSAGLESLHGILRRQVPWLGDRILSLQDWRQFTLLAVESGCLEHWHRPGLLLIGDAAHIMSPVGGVGISYAIQDAVEAANHLTEPLRRGAVSEADLARVQRRRAASVSVIQTFQRFMQEQIVRTALRTDRPFRLPLPMRVLLRLPGLRSLPARLIGYGWRPSRIRPELVAARPG